MASKPISQRKRFDSAIVLRSFCMANPCSNGFAELAIRSTSRYVEIWAWIDEYPPECSVKLHRKTTWREALAVFPGDEMLSTPISLSEVTWRGCPDYQGQLFSAAWKDDYNLQRAAVLLTKFDDSTLERLAKHWPKHLHAALPFLATIDETEIELSDIREGIHLDKADLKQLKEALHAELRPFIEKHKAKERAAEEAAKAWNEKRERAFSLFRVEMANLLDRWVQANPCHRTPSGEAITHPDYSQLRTFIEFYVTENQELPTGVHQIEGGRYGRYKTEKRDSFLVDFDALAHATSNGIAGQGGANVDSNRCS
jgi:hypothetical protein